MSNITIAPAAPLSLSTVSNRPKRVTKFPWNHCSPASVESWPAMSGVAYSFAAKNADRIDCGGPPTSNTTMRSRSSAAAMPLEYRTSGAVTPSSPVEPE